MSVTRTDAIFDGTYTTDQDTYLDIGQYNKASLHIVQPGSGALVVSLSNDIRFTSAESNKTQMALKSWVNAFLYNHTTQTWVSSVNLTGTEDLVSLNEEILTARYMRIQLIGPSGAYKVYLNVKE